MAPQNDEIQTDSEALTKGKRMSVREQLFAQGLLEGKTQRDAALYAGYPPTSADNRASEKMASLRFREKLQAYALAQGIGIEYALGKLHNLMEARAVALGGKDKNEVIELGQDGATQAKGMDMFLKVMGAYPDPRADVNVNAAVTVVLRSADSLAVDPFADASTIDGETREIEDGTDVLP